MSINFSTDPKYEVHKNSINISRFVSCGNTQTDRHDKANSSSSHFFGSMRKNLSLGNTKGRLSLDSSTETS